METSQSDILNSALDRFAGLCAVGALSDPSLETITNGRHTAFKVTGSTWWEADEYPVSVWAGTRDGQLGEPGSDHVWLQLGSETIPLGGITQESLLKAVPLEGLNSALKALLQAKEMLAAANEAMGAATPKQFNGVIHTMKEIASESAAAVEYKEDADAARDFLELQCRSGLLSNMAVSESDDCDLAFDLAADTLDPATGETVRLRVFWAPVGGDSEHALELAGETCLAHDEEDVDRLLAGQPEKSRGHYESALACLHAMSDAVEEYAAAKVGMAGAAESTVDSPLLHEARYELAHRVYREVAAELDRLVKDM